MGAAARRGAEAGLVGAVTAGIGAAAATAAAEALGSAVAGGMASGAAVALFNTATKCSSGACRAQEGVQGVAGTGTALAVGAACMAVLAPVAVPVVASVTCPAAAVFSSMYVCATCCARSHAGAVC